MDTGETREQSLSTTLSARTGELAVAAGAARAKAMVEAAYLVAINRPRNLEKAEAEILPMCEDPVNADQFRWERPVGRKQDANGKWVDVWGEGLSIRFAEVAIQALTNITPTSEIIHEDERIRMIRCSMTDLERNVIWSKDIVLAKTVERLKLKKDQVAISSRENSNGQIVYEVAATELEMQNKQARAESIAQRTNGLRLVPAPIKAKAWERIIKTLEENAKVNSENLAKLKASFTAQEIGATVEEMEKLCGHSFNQMTMNEYLRFRGLYRAIKDGETTWKETIESLIEPQPEAESGEISMDDLEPGEESEATDPAHPLFGNDTPPAGSASPRWRTCKEAFNEYKIRRKLDGRKHRVAFERISELCMEQFGTEMIGEMPDEQADEFGLWLNGSCDDVLKKEGLLPNENDT